MWLVVALLCLAFFIVGAVVGSLGTITIIAKWIAR